MVYKDYKELSIADNFMFCKIFSTRLDLCRRLIEILLERKVKEVKVAEQEKVIDIIAGAKRVQLDVYATEEDGTVYNLEMQTAHKPVLEKRARYYSGMIDLNQLEKGTAYKKLPDSIVIFLCTFDHGQRGLPVYEYENRCKADPDMVLGDGRKIIFVNLMADTRDCTEEVRNLYSYFLTGLSSDPFTEDLDNAVSNARLYQDWRVEYMEWRANEMDHECDLIEARAEGKAETNTLIDLITMRLSEGETVEELIASGLDPEQVMFCARIIERFVKLND